jgi:hypothetical protein
MPYELRSMLALPRTGEPVVFTTNYLPATTTGVKAATFIPLPSNQVARHRLTMHSSGSLEHRYEVIPTAEP